MNINSFKLRLPLITLSVSALVAFLGCAGPATPLGAIRAMSSDDLQQASVSRLTSLFDRPELEMGDPLPTTSASISSVSDGDLAKQGSIQGSGQGSGQNQTKIQFDPPRQVMHKAVPLKIRIEDPLGIKSNYRFLVRYNGVDVTPSFLARSKVDVTTNSIEITNPLLRLRADRKHEIDVIYSPDRNLNYYWRSKYTRLEEPHCILSDEKDILNTDDFKPEKWVLNLIDSYANESKINPSLIAALIAQESSFDPNKISWAKAMGLTQITPSAEKEIQQEVSQWPKYRAIEATPVVWLKTLVSLGAINSENEWKLNEEKSIRGGIAYLKFILEKWSSRNNQRIIRALFKNPAVAQTELVLASYHSGYSRVLDALTSEGSKWLDSRKLKQARIYVNRVTSLCDQFATRSYSHSFTGKEYSSL